VTRLFLYCLLALGLGAVLALLLADDPGYLLLYFRGYSVEATLSAVVLALLACGLLLFALVWLVRILNPAQWFRGAGWQPFRRGNAAQASANGLQQLLLGRWQEAYKLLVENAERADNPACNYVAASLAAFRIGDRLSWSYCLDQAEKKFAADASGITSLRALLETKSGEHEKALAMLAALQKSAPTSPLVLEQLRDIRLTLNDWDGLAALLPELEKYKVMAAADLHALSAMVHLHKLEQAAGSGLDSLRLAWQELPKALRNDAALTAAYLRKLLSFSEDTEAGLILVRQLKHAWSDELAALLGYVNSSQPQQQLLTLESWLRDRPGNAVLLLSLGRLSLRNQLWGKAREYFEHALRASQSPALTAEISAELGRLLESLGEHERSLACYQRAMGLLDHKLPELPQPVGS
jgi:HemY protein